MQPEPNEIALRNYRHLEVLIGSALSGSSNTFGTRSFYFGELSSSKKSNQLAPFVLTIDCAWRIESGDGIIVASHDFYIRAEGNLDDSWQPGSQEGHLQDELLRKVLGDDPGRGIIKSVEGKLVLTSLHTDGFGGFRMTFSDGHSLSVFPDGARSTYWNLLGADGSFVEMTTD